MDLEPLDVEPTKPPSVERGRLAGMDEQSTQAGSLMSGDLVGRPSQPGDMIAKSSGECGAHTVPHRLHVLLRRSRHRPSPDHAGYLRNIVQVSCGSQVATTRRIVLVTEEAPTPGIISVLRSTTRTMINELLEALDSAGYPDMQAAFHPLFECIDEEGTRLTELAARADMTHQSMSEVVVSLEQRGYLERRPDPTDGRARLVCLTPAGQKLRRVGTEKIREIERLWQARWREAGIDADVRTAFSSALGSTRR